MVLENILVIKVIVEIVVNSDKRKIDNSILPIDTSTMELSVRGSQKYIGN